MSLTKEQIEQTIAFHGHNCPGLTIGLKVAELALTNLDITNKSDWVCVTETDMCGVDAIQYLTGCSFGKGNLIHRDFGKSAYTFFDRKAGRGFRALFKDNGAQSDNREERIQLLLKASLDDLFDMEPVEQPPVRPARILKSIPCSRCKERTMESRIRLFDGEMLCIPCFNQVEQKI